ncbi:MAG: FAD-binding oxidoreductase [Microthrixaceae bacterium]|nr:FAD-binding oxidoreductase [Microthrixaceae bacterium]
MTSDSGIPRIDPGPGAPTPPIGIAGGAPDASTRTDAVAVGIPDAVLERLRAAGAAVSVEQGALAEAGRDWWPLAMTWATEGIVPARAGALVAPESAEQVPEILAVCNENRIPVTASAGRSGVLGGSVPLFGGVQLDLCGLAGIAGVDDTSLVVDVGAGTFGDRFEDELRDSHGLTCGHWPQSMVLSTVGGWLACRGAGQLSTRYGKIEDMVVGLDVALADGTTITTGGAPRQATGPDLNQLFVGSEGTLGVITSARLRVHPAPAATARGAWAFEGFPDGLDFCRRILRRGATPAVLRLYDGVESDRNYHLGTDRSVVLVLDEGDEILVEASLAVARDEARNLDGAPAERLDDSVLDHWIAKRNDVSQLEPLVEGGIVVDTMEVSGRWSVLPGAYRSAIDAMSAVPGCLAASAHASHSYGDGACLYFTFAGKVEGDDNSLEARAALHRAMWAAGQEATLAAGCAVSHHHGIGLHRGAWLRGAMGHSHDVLAALKTALDPNGILNPGKLGLPSPFGSADLPR